MHKLIAILLLLASCNSVVGQVKGSGKTDLEQVGVLLKKTKLIAYKFEMRSIYPNGTIDDVKGDVFVDNEHKFLFNNTSAITIIYDGTYLYKADHREKAIMLLNVAKHVDKNTRENLESDAFKSDLLSTFLDSILLKHAIVNATSHEGDTVSIKVGFPSKMILKEVDIRFDKKNNRLGSFSLRSFTPWQGKEYGKDKGTTLTVKCSDFQQPKDKKRYSLSNYFTISNGKVSLKQYKKYQLNIKL